VTNPPAADRSTVSQARILKVFIASPGDLAKEREMLAHALGEWNAQNAGEYLVVFLPVTWETHAYSQVKRDGRAQGIINDQILDDCDLLLGMFWGRVGTPTGRAASGTIEEIEHFLAADKPVLLYFSRALAKIDGINPVQLAKVEKFKKQMTRRGLVFEFEDAAQFREMIFRQLTQYARHLKLQETINIIDDRRVERFRWELLEPELKAALYERFNALEPKHHIPRTITAPAELQRKLEAKRPLPFDVLRNLLEVFGFSSGDVLIPAGEERLTRVQGLNRPLADRIFESVEAGLSAEEVRAVGQLFACLSAENDGRQAGSGDLTSCDVVLVPGSRRGHRYRVDIALGIAQRSGATIILSGGHPLYDPDQPLAMGEADAMAYYLESKTVDQSITVLRDSRARSTAETLLHVWPELVQLAVAKRGPLDMVVVTSPYHMRRLLTLCDAFFEDRTHVVRSVKGILSTASFDRNVFFSKDFDPVRRRYGIGVYVQEIFKLYGGRVTGEF
jgi:uncharacterized SAM-binding protein YcdF (DUF218 family)